MTSTDSSPPKASETKVQFAPKTEFSSELKHRIDEYFKTTELSPRGNLSLYIKTFVILSWFASSYYLLVFVSIPLWAKFLVSISLGLAISGIGFSVMHDGGHRSYSNNELFNRLAALTLDGLGGSSYVWRWKHNVLHHSFANITHHDDDLNVGPLGRLSPYQESFPAHKYQHYYMWVLYGFLPAKWHTFDDYNCLIKGKIGEQNFPRPKGWELFTFFAGKTIFYTWALIIPSLFHPIWLVICFYLLVTAVEGFVLAVVFQMAHCVEEAHFPAPATQNPNIDVDWCVHQIQTTINFAPNNRLLSWYVGGLNYQIEHHLFPKISHVHYPAMSKIVQKTCEDFDIPYITNPTLYSSLRSHYRWLKHLGASPMLVASKSTP